MIEQEVRSVVEEKPYYILTKDIIEEYDMERTKENVEKLVKDYKKAKYQFFASSQNLDRITSLYEPKYSQHLDNRSDKLSNSVATRIDSSNVVINFEEIFNSLLYTMNGQEKKYYNICLAESNSEQIVANILGISRTGLQPIKNSCILKIALAFNIAIERI